MTVGDHRETGLLVINLQKDWASQEQAQRIRADVPHYAVCVATRFQNLPRSPWRDILHDDRDGGPIIDIGAAKILAKPTYGLSDKNLRKLRAYPVIRWHLCSVGVNPHVLGCAMALWDAGLPFQLRADLCADSTPLPPHGLALMEQMFGQQATVWASETVKDAVEGTSNPSPNRSSGTSAVD